MSAFGWRTSVYYEICRLFYSVCFYQAMNRTSEDFENVGGLVIVYSSPE